MQRALRTVALAGVVCSAAAFGQGQTPGSSPSGPKPPNERPGDAKASPRPSDPFGPLRDALGAALQRGCEPGGFETCAARVDGLWAWSAAHVPVEELEVLTEMAAAKRTIDHLRSYKGDKGSMLTFLRSSPSLARTLAFLVAGGEGDDPAAVYAVLDELRKAYSASELERLAQLAAAVCVVYDRPVIKQVNENSAQGVSAVEAFGFFARHEGRMVYSPRTTPAELLVFVVDAAATADEIGWAFGRYAGQREVGPRYSEIKYDNDHFKRNKPKKISADGMFNLPNIKKYGGVCADQAHFASTVGKVIGVPAVVVSGEGSDVGHAWLGYLKAGGGGARWDFDTGRYDQYEDIRGMADDPQTGRAVPDGTLALTAESMRVSQAVRNGSTALADAAARLASAGAGGTPAGVEVGVAPAGRTGSVEQRLELLRQSLTLYPVNMRAWNLLRSMAQARQLSLAQKQEWAGAVQRLCGTQYPDFALAVLTPMVTTIDAPAEQGAIWNGVFDMVRAQRPDLAAEVLILQGRMWERANDPARAYDCFTRAAMNYLEDGTASVTALRLCEELLVKRQAQGEVLPMYERAFKRITRPDGMSEEFMRQSNWFRIGERYLHHLQQSGMTQKAGQVERQLGLDEGSENRRERQRQRYTN